MGLSTSTIFQLGFIPPIPAVLTLTLGDTFLKVPSKIKGIPFIAYILTSVPSRFILTVCVGTSASNSLSCGTNEVCNLGLPVIPVTSVGWFPNCKIDSLPEETIETWPPYEILAFACTFKSELLALVSEELQELTLDVEISASLYSGSAELSSGSRYRYLYLIELPSNLPLIVRFPNNIEEILARSNTTDEYDFISS